MSAGTVVVGPRSMPSSFSLRTCVPTLGAIANCFAVIGWTIGLLIVAASFYGPAEVLLERLLFW